VGHPFRRAAFCAAALVLLSSCATTKIVGSWTDNTAKGPFRKVVVVGIFETADTREVYEDEFRDRLKARGMEAFASRNLFPKNEMPGKDVAVAEFRKRGADAVLVTRVLDTDRWKEVSRGKSYFVPVYYGVYGDYLGYAYTTARATDEGFAYTETNLYELDNGKLVWSARADTQFKGRRYDLIREFVKVAIGRLVEDGMIR
jgi:hypothetical protein